MIAPLGIFDDNQKCLDVLTTNIRCRLEITLNYPRTKPFLRMDKEAQMDLYRNIFYLYKQSFESLHKGAILIRSDQTFELSSDRCIHSHAYVEIDMKKSFSVEGLVTEALRFLVFQMPKRNHQYLGTCHYSQRFRTYRTPSVLVQYSDSPRRNETWEGYIHKNDT